MAICSHSIQLRPVHSREGVDVAAGEGNPQDDGRRQEEERKHGGNERRVVPLPDLLHVVLPCLDALLAAGHLFACLPASDAMVSWQQKREQM